MQIQISGQHINLGESLQTYAKESIEKTVQKYFPNPIDAEIKITKEGGHIKTEITVHPAMGLTLRAELSSTDAYSSFDGAVVKMSRQLSRYKNKLLSHKGGVPAQTAELSVIDSESEKEEVTSEAPAIIAEMQTQIPECSVSEAVMYMDLAGLPALLFKNKATNSFNMVYRRADGNIGWVNPK